MESNIPAFQEFLEAIKMGELDEVKSQLALFPNVLDVSESTDLHPLHVAILYERDSIVELLLQLDRKSVV